MSERVKIVLNCDRDEAYNAFNIAESFMLNFKDRKPNDVVIYRVDDLGFLVWRTKTGSISVNQQFIPFPPGS